jgi:hypothetical protein
MPIESSIYNPPALFKNRHLSTLYAALLRNVSAVNQQRERIILSDGDFLDIDWSYTSQKNNSVIIVLHGLEGNAQRPYMLGTTKAFLEHEYDVACVNLRGCSGVPNNLYSSYHSGISSDLHEVIEYILERKKYKQLFLKGFSLGGNVVLKYLGEYSVPKEVKAAVAVSTPCHLYDSMLELHKPNNWIYTQNFRKHLKSKLHKKQQQFPENISISKIKSIKTLKDFDDIYTAPANGFKNAIDYYKKCSSLQFLPAIKTPTLIINAKNDSFLPQSCYPTNEAQENKFLWLDMPNYGGHVGFIEAKDYYFNEKRALAFMKAHHNLSK